MQLPCRPTSSWRARRARRRHAPRQPKSSRPAATPARGEPALPPKKPQTLRDSSSTASGRAWACRRARSRGRRKARFSRSLAAQAAPHAQRRRQRSRPIREKLSGESKDEHLRSLPRTTAARSGAEAPPARRADFLRSRRGRRGASRRIPRAERSQCEKRDTPGTPRYVARRQQENGRAGNAMCAR